MGYFPNTNIESKIMENTMWALVKDKPEEGLMMPDIRAFFEFEEGKREFEEWKAQRDVKAHNKKDNKEKYNGTKNG